MLCPYDYAIVRVVPRVERQEFINAGVIVSCQPRQFLEALIELDETRLLALAPDVDLEAVRQNLTVIPLICRGGAEGGPIGRLPLRERFHWLVAPRSTVIQTSAVHLGRGTDPQAALADLMDKMVRRRPAGQRRDC